MARNCQNVHELYQKLRQGSYERIDDLTLDDFLDRYFTQLIGAALDLLLLGALRLPRTPALRVDRSECGTRSACQPRRIDRAPEPAAFQLFAQGSWRAPVLTVVVSPCVSSASTVSRRWTMHLGTRVATKCCGSRRGGDGFAGVRTSVAERQVAEGVASKDAR